jgi:ATP-dependent RNA helicase DDX56/DBP9
MSAILDSEKTWVQRDFGLDRRLVKALSKLGYVHPTLVQSKSLPIALQGKDLLVRARTGSGKTVAFGLPILHKILTTKDAEKNSVARIHCIILAPTKELCKQIEKNMTDLTYYCRETISLVALLDDNVTVQKYRLQNKPDIVISTPAKLVAQIKAGVVDLSTAKLLVIDEADLVLSFGYTADVHSITSKLPKIFQGLFMSATLSPELDKFKRVVLHNPAVLKLEEAKGVGHLLQFFLESTEDDKYLILYVFMRLGLLQGKGLIFVNDVSKCYRLKLFLQQFYISAAVLNSEVPLNSRLHMLDEFNRGVFDYLIATDTTVDRGDDDEEDSDEDEEDEEDVSGEDDEEEDSDDEDGEDEVLDKEKALELGYDFGDEEEDSNGGDNSEDDDDDDNSEDEEGSNDGENSDDNKKKSKKNNDDAEKESSKKRSRPKSSKKSSVDDEEDYGVARGIDFQAVNFVINFDFPKTAAAYTHRIGRTARGGASGTALSFVTIPGMKDTYLSESATAIRDSETLSEVRLQQPRLGSVEGDNILAAIAGPAGATQEQDESTMQPAPLVFNMKELESFRYRVYDTLRSVTSAAVKEFRTAEIKREILNSTKLKTFFMENPNDLKVLRHDKAILHPIKQKDHLKHVPDYLIPTSMRSVANTSNKKKKRKNMKSGHTAEARSMQSKMKDPLQNPDLDTNTSTIDTTNNDINGGGGDNVNEGDRDNVYTNTEQLGSSISGRKAWQIKHRKGKFNEKASKKNAHRTPGAFLKSKQYK